MHFVVTVFDILSLQQIHHLIKVPQYLFWYDGIYILQVACNSINTTFTRLLKTGAVQCEIIISYKAVCLTVSRQLIETNA